MAFYWFWILLVLFAIMLAAYPTWPHARGWGYGPSLGALVVIIVIAGMIWLGFLAVWWPWTGTVQYY